MEFEFEEFEDGQVLRTGERVYVTINERGNLYFNVRALAALGGPDGVSLLFDAKRKVIGVRSTPLNRKSTYKLKPKDSARTRARVITALNFCRHYQILPKETLAFRSAEVRDGIMVLDLNEVARVPRKAKG